LYSNATPQKGGESGFNQGAWKELEQWLSQYYRQFYVFTGPILTENSSVFRGVRIPPAFWKVAAFIKDDTVRTAGFLKAQHPEWFLINKSYKGNEPDQTLYQISVAKIYGTADLLPNGQENMDTLEEQMYNVCNLYTHWRPIHQKENLIL
jgi:DNA/RNA endonuclease G (NUC1)